MGIYQKLFAVQQALVAPKDQFNSFGKYKYRSCEGILEALKPLLAQNKLVVTLTDDVKLVGDRVYIEAAARVTDLETGEGITCSAFAREEETKKGMDASQVTGATSSYARKYALNGLFAIDDNKDSDVTNTGEQKEEKKQESELYKKAEDYIRAEGNTKYARCARCNAYIYDQQRKDGSIMSVKDYVAACIKTYGEPVCRDCRKNESQTA